MRSDRPISERRPDVLKIVPDDTFSVFLDHRVECVAGFHVCEIRPCAENLERSQLPPMLVRDDVIRIIRTRSEILEAAEDFSRQKLARNRAVRTIRTSFRPAQYIFQIAPAHRTNFSGRHADDGLFLDLKIFGANEDQVGLSLPVT